MPTNPAITEAMRREAICHQAATLIDEHKLSLNEAARQLRVPKANLFRYLKAWRAGGFEALLPKQANSGVTSLRSKWVEELGEEAVVELEKRVAGLAIDTDKHIDGRGRAVSDGLAWREIARDPATPEPVREYFSQPRRSKHYIAPSIREATRVGALVNARHRGARAFALEGPYQPRELDILAGDIFSSDDTTPIWAWWVPWPKSEKYPYGCKVLQGQFLPVIDVASQAPLCYTLIAREQSSYRAADIWRLMARVHTLVGLPRLGWQKERGSWEAGLIDGVSLDQENDIDPGHTRRVGGLRMLPSNLLGWHVERMGVEKAARWKTLHTFTSYCPKSKSVEGIFQRLQRFEGTMWGTLGKSQQRRPFERVKKLYDTCRAGKADPRLNFLSGTELMHRLNACIESLCAEPIEGEVFRGKPMETWEAGLREHGELLAEPPQGRWLMCADWGKVTVLKGYARVRRVDEATGFQVSYFYTHPDFFGRLDGREVLVYFNRDEFERPANILVPVKGADPEYLGEAEYVSRKGMFLDGDVDGFELRKRQSGIVATLYSDLAAYIPSRQLPPEIAQRRRAAFAMETRGPGGDFASVDTRPPAESSAPQAWSAQRAESEWDEEADLAAIHAAEEAARERGEIFSL